MASCPNCFPEVKYQCSEHRPKNQCVGCLKTNKKLIFTLMGFICEDCAFEQGLKGNFIV